MDDRELRLECLKLAAVAVTGTFGDVVATAAVYWNFVASGGVAPPPSGGGEPGDGARGPLVLVDSFAAAKGEVMGTATFEFHGPLYTENIDDLIEGVVGLASMRQRPEAIPVPPGGSGSPAR